MTVWGLGVWGLGVDGSALAFEVGGMPEVGPNKQVQAPMTVNPTSQAGFEGQGLRVGVSGLCIAWRFMGRQEVSLQTP